MLLVFVGATLGLAIAGLTVFAAMCVAIKDDDRNGLPLQAPSLTARLARWLVGLSGSRSARPTSPDSQSQLMGSAAGQPSQSWPEGR